MSKIRIHFFRSTDTEPSTSPAPLLEEQTEDEDILTKHSCHDSGIDIRESAPLPMVVPISAKKVSLSSYHFLSFNRYLIG